MANDQMAKYNSATYVSRGDAGRDRYARNRVPKLSLGQTTTGICMNLWRFILMGLRLHQRPHVFDMLD